MKRMLAVAAGVAVIGLSAAAEAAHTCAEGVPLHFNPSADTLAAGFEVEGKIGAYDLSARTITANGMTFSVPEDLPIATIELDGPGNLTFAELVDPALEAVRSIIGGTVIALGNLEVAGTGTDLCLISRATSVYVELAENVVFGPLIAVEGSAANLNGTTVTASTDPRWPARLIDEGGNEYPLERIAELVGQPVSAEGYFEDGVLRATVLEFEGVLPGEGTDTVAITRAEEKGNGVRVRGTVSVNPATGTFVPSVTVYAGLLATGGGCTGTVLGTAPVSATSGSFELRTRQGGAPPTVCVSSPAGGAAQATVDRD